jgi:hypothetical protein
MIVVEVQHIAALDAHEQRHAVRGEPPPAVATGLLPLEARPPAEGTGQLRHMRVSHALMMTDARKCLAMAAGVPSSKSGGAGQPKFVPMNRPAIRPYGATANPALTGSGARRT